MNKLMGRVLSALGLGSTGSTDKGASNSPQKNAGVVQGLRMKALSLKAQDIGLNRQNFPKLVWGILFETAYDRGAFTLVVLGDGTASLYFSTGGGIIGAGPHQSVRKASEQLLSAASHFVSSASPVTTYPMPVSGQSTFYFLSYDGVLSYSANERELGEGRDKLSGLFHAAHGVVARMREIQQARRGDAAHGDEQSSKTPE